MCHYVILNGKKVRGPHLQADAESGEVLSWSVTYTPDHSLTDEQVGDRVARLLKLGHKMEEVAE